RGGDPARGGTAERARLHAGVHPRRLPAHRPAGPRARPAPRQPEVRARRRGGRGGAERRADPPALGAARLPQVRGDVPCRVQSTGARGALRPVRRRTVPARGRPARSHRSSPRASCPRGRAGRGILPGLRAPASRAGHRHAGRRLRADPGEPGMILLKSPDEIERMRRSSAIVAEILAAVASRVRPGVTTGELDTLAEELTRKKGAKPAFKGYVVGGRTFPASICISVNDEVVHGIPSRDRVLRDGDLVGLDFGVCCDGYFGDAARTVSVGRTSPEARRLMDVTAASLAAGIEAIRPGAHIADISGAIQDVAEGAGFSLVREFVGHGIGRSLHEDPQVPNYRTGTRGVKLSEGLVLAIEPMVNAGGPEVYVKDDGWTAATRDGRLSAHFEHSVAVTANGPYILSKP